jgi:hypothetical protein
MFGGMGGGIGGGRSTLRMVRFGALAVFLILAATLHDRGSTYNTLHVVYFVIIAGLLVASFAGRRGRGRFGSGGPGGSRLGGGSFGSGSPRPDAAVDNSDPEADSQR